MQVQPYPSPVKRKRNVGFQGNRNPSGKLCAEAAALRLKVKPGIVQPSESGQLALEDPVDFVLCQRDVEAACRLELLVYALAQTIAPGVVGAEVLQVGAVDTGQPGQVGCSDCGA